MTAHIMEAVWVSEQKCLHGLLILNHLHCSFFLLKFYIQFYYSLSVWEHLTVRYQSSSKGVSEYLEIWITAMLLGKHETLPRIHVHRENWENWDPSYPGVGVDTWASCTGRSWSQEGGGGNCHFHLLVFVFQHRQIDTWLNRHISQSAFQRLLLQNH